MKNCAVICELNPFHSGHKKIIDSVRDTANNIVCIMSGQFVQSAEPAICDKSIRAESAVLCGVDAVIELPAVYSTASAKSFAEGAVKILSKVKDITNIAFGASSDKDTLLRLADIKITRASEFEDLLKKYLKHGKSYNFASRGALSELYRAKYGEADVSAVLDDPNSLLGIEYICAIDKFGAKTEPIIVSRRGNHLTGKYYTQEYTSATNIRKALKTNDKEISKYIPFNYDKLKNFMENHAPDVSAYKKAAVFAIKTMETREISELRDCSDGMEFLIKNIARKSDYDDIVNSADAKIFGVKRIKRLLLDALCGIKKQHLESAFITRLLACKNNFDFTLLPDFVKTNNRDLKFDAEQNNDVKSVLEIDERVTALYNTLCTVDGDYYNYSLVKI